MLGKGTSLGTRPIRTPSRNRSSVERCGDSHHVQRVVVGPAVGGGGNLSSRTLAADQRGEEARTEAGHRSRCEVVTSHGTLALGRILTVAAHSEIEDPGVTLPQGVTNPDNHGDLVQARENSVRQIDVIVFAVERELARVVERCAAVDHAGLAASPVDELGAHARKNVVSQRRRWEHSRRRPRRRRRAAHRQRPRCPQAGNPLSFSLRRAATARQPAEDVHWIAIARAYAQDPERPEAAAGCRPNG